MTDEHNTERRHFDGCVLRTLPSAMPFRPIGMYESLLSQLPALPSALPFRPIGMYESLLSQLPAFCPPGDNMSPAPSGRNVRAPFRLQPDCGYSDLAVLPDGTVLCLWETKSDIPCARFTLDWSTAP